MLSILLLCAAFCPQDAAAQNEEWQLIHQGNRAFKNKQYRTAESYYRKALSADAKNTRALYNLGNVYLTRHGEADGGNADSTALDFYQKVCKAEPNKNIRSRAYHNAGFIHQRQAGEARQPQDKQQALRAAIEAYNWALRETPAAHSSRYNLALCQKQLKDSEDNNKQDKQQQQQQEKQEQQKKKEKQEEKKSDNQPLINYARQAEQKTREKLNRRVYQQRLEKNW